MKKQLDLNERLSDKDFYEQAYAYFTYHAGQRTAMINFYIAVFGASIALYGSLLEKCPPASIMIGVFSCIVTVLFYKIDIRNRFDVKMSQSVICQFEQDYGLDRPGPGANFAGGVFSNEDHNFKYYTSEGREPQLYKSLRKEYLRAKKSGKIPQELMDRIQAFADTDAHISAAALISSFNSGTIPHLSSLIKWLYYTCGVISIASTVLAVLVASGYL
jgi:hypothetical protein